MLSVSDRSNAIWIDGGPRVADVLRQAVLAKRWYVWMYSTTLSFAHLADGRITGICISVLQEFRVRARFTLLRVASSPAKRGPL
jgi:hypothetical protein